MKHLKVNQAKPVDTKNSKRSRVRVKAGPLEAEVHVDQEQHKWEVRAILLAVGVSILAVGSAIAGVIGRKGPGGGTGGSSA